MAWLLVIISKMTSRPTHQDLAAMQEAREITFRKFDPLIRNVKRKMKRWCLGSESEFSVAITSACKPKPQHDRTIKSVKAKAFDDALRECGGHQSKAAKILGVTRGTVREYLSRVTVCAALILMAGTGCHEQRNTEVNPVAPTSVAPAQAIMTSIFALAVAPTTPKQSYLTWDVIPGASNRVEWGTVRDRWTNGFRVVATNIFPITNGWCYAVKSIVNGVESVPALWPSNRYDRVWIQTSTNLVNWADAFVWTTNYNKPQEYLRLRSELIRWE